MRLSKTVCLVVIGILAIASLSYAYTVMVNLAPTTTGPKVEQTVEETVADEQKPINAAKTDDTRTKGDKGSPMHAWKAIVTAGKKAGDTITTQEFGKLRNWSARTRGYELQSLVALGVLERVNTGVYKVAINATSVQIDEINRQAVPIVNKRGIRGEALGIDAYKLDEAYLGAGKVDQLRILVGSITGQETKLAEGLPADFVEADGVGGTIPAAVFINENKPFTVAGQEVETADANKQAVLAALVDMRLLEPQAEVKSGAAADFRQTKVQTVLFKSDFVTNDPKAFAAVYGEQVANNPDKIAVIISTSGDPMEPAIKTALEQAELLGEWGNKIIVMGVQPNSPAADAFARLFGDKNILTNFNEARKILDNKDAVMGVAGGV